MIQSIKSIFNLLPSLVILFFVLGGAYYLNEKLDKMESMWLSSNQVTVENQQAQIEINRAFSDQMDGLTSQINKLPPDARNKWYESYDEQIQKLLSMPPKGLEDQSHG